MIKVTFLVEPFTGNAQIWKQVEDIEHPWKLTGKIKLSKLHDGILISLLEIKKVVATLKL